MSVKEEIVDEISWCLKSSMGWADLYTYTISKSNSYFKGFISIKSADYLIEGIKRNKE